MKLLQNSSTVIEKLIFYGDTFTTNATLDISRRVADRFATTLTDIHLKDAGDFLVCDTSHTFPNVARIVLEYDDLPERLQLGRIYPAARALELHMERPLAVRDLANLNFARAAAALQSMPRLQNLTIVGVANALLPSIEANLRHLEKLSINYYLSEHSMPWQPNRTFHFDSVRILYLQLMNGRRGAIQPIPLRFDGLESVVLMAPKDDDNVSEWIERHAALREYSMYHSRMGKDALDRLASALGRLPKLQDVYLGIEGGQNLSGTLPPLRHVKMVTVSLTSSGAKETITTIPTDWHIVEDFSVEWAPKVYLTPIRRR